jgi:acetyl esterase
VPLDEHLARFVTEHGAALAFPAGGRTDAEIAGRFLAGIRPQLNTPSVAPAEHVMDVHDESVDGRLNVRVYRNDPGPGQNLVVYLHGGGWVSGGLEMNDPLCRRLALATGAVIVSVDYRLAPESPYPHALRDTVSAIEWARENAERLGGDAERLAVVGTSAGGNLIAGACLLMRDLELPLPRVQLLLYPVLDLPSDAGSYVENGTGYLLEREQMEWYWDCYLPHRQVRVPSYAAPVRATDLSGLPPAIVISAEYDPLRDAYAARLAAAGVPVELVRCAGMIHGFLSFLNASPAVATILEQIVGSFTQLMAQPDS